MEPIKGNFNDVLVITELRGGFPDVTIASDVDIAALTAGDDKPVYLTLPIGRAGVTSGNQRHYDEKWLTELERQTLAQRPVGLMGHLSKEERLHAFPIEAIHWLGTAREGSTLWAKGYVPPGEARARIQRYKAQGKKIATSIDAYGEGQWDEGLGAWRMDAASMKLGQIDIAPADRAGIPGLAEVPILTTEMEQATDNKEPVMDKLQVINEMTAEDARLLPEPVRAAILAAVPAPAEVGQITELRTALGVDANTNLVALITEMRKAQTDATKAAVAARIKARVEDPEKGVKVVALRGMITELITARNPADVAAADVAIDAVFATDTVKAVLAGGLTEIMGPPQGAPLGTPAGQTNKPASWYTIPAAA